MSVQFEGTEKQAFRHHSMGIRLLLLARILTLGAVFVFFLVDVIRNIIVAATGGSDLFSYTAVLVVITIAAIGWFNHRIGGAVIVVICGLAISIYAGYLNYSVDYTYYLGLTLLLSIVLVGGICYVLASFLMQMEKPKIAPFGLSFIGFFVVALFTYVLLFQTLGLFSPFNRQQMLRNIIPFVIITSIVTLLIIAGFVLIVVGIKRTRRQRVH